jgi:phospholipase/carboxylesterase
MNTLLLPYVEINPQSPLRYTVIWLHGLGASGHDFESIIPHLGLEDSWGVRFVFPHAPSMPITVNGGLVMPAWYDIAELGGRGQDDQPGILRSVDQIHALMEQEYKKGLNSSNILLAGFSQGGAIALHVASRYPQPLGGVMALSTYMVRQEALAQEASPHIHGLKAFAAHGEQDPMVPFTGGKMAAETLAKLGATVTWKAYSMQHEVCMEEIADLGVWLREIVAP